MQKWQYAVVNNPSETLLNNMGRQGWELVAVRTTTQSHNTCEAYLKRLA